MVVATEIDEDKVPARQALVAGAQQLQDLLARDALGGELRRGELGVPWRRRLGAFARCAAGLRFGHGLGDGIEEAICVMGGALCRAAIWSVESFWIRRLDVLVVVVVGEKVGPFGSLSDPVPDWSPVSLAHGAAVRHALATSYLSMGHQHRETDFISHILS